MYNSVAVAPAGTEPEDPITHARDRWHRHTPSEEVLPLAAVAHIRHSQTLIRIVLLWRAASREPTHLFWHVLSSRVSGYICFQNPQIM